MRYVLPACWRADADRSMRAATRAELLRRLRRERDARAEYLRALELASDARGRALLRPGLAEL